jgi:hypothetical protein
MSMSTLDSQVMAAIIAAAIAGPTALINFLYTFYHNKKQKFMEQIEYYESKLAELRRGFTTSQQSKDECREYAIHFLTVLDRIAYLRNNGLVNRAFVRYFEYYFNTGRAYLIWLNSVFKSDRDWGSIYYNFIRLTEDKNEIIYALKEVRTFPSFYYHLSKENNPYTRTPVFLLEPRDYLVPDGEYNLLDPFNTEARKLFPEVQPQQMKRLDCERSFWCRLTGKFP